METNKKHERMRWVFSEGGYLTAYFGREDEDKFKQTYQELHNAFCNGELKALNCGYDINCGYFLTILKG